MRTIGHWIGGQPTAGTSGRTAPVHDPATGVVTGQVQLASAEETAGAVRSAQEASRAWGGSSLSTRATKMFALRELVHAQRDRLVAAIVSEHGKVTDDAAGEVARGLECIEFACGLPQLLKGAHSSEVSTGIDVHTVLQPVGVVAGITPFNFPVMVPLWMLANSLACGNAFILKPSEKDPSASLILAELVAEAGFPAGILTVLQGDVEAVDTLLTHPDVDAISFVGSTPVARRIHEVGTREGKRVQALGGAKNHMVVLPDADLGAAADAAVNAAYGSAGERCMAISVAVVVGSIADDFVRAVADRIPGITIGPGHEKASMMGPLITREHRDRVKGYVSRAAEEGAEVVVDGRTHPTDRGFFIGCSLVDGVKPGMGVYDDEIFGPVLSVVRVPTYEDAVALVNDNPYGNGVALFTRDGGAARRFQREVTVGMVGINVPIPVPVAWHSFGGWKDVTQRWPDPSTSVINLGFPTNT
jgi:malonate-semialdehyde dehydrogenase (acetylating)/methylmalonate-semialdehyde dehydrogenase